MDTYECKEVGVPRVYELGTLNPQEYSIEISELRVSSPKPCFDKRVADLVEFLWGKSDTIEDRSWLNPNNPLSSRYWHVDGSVQGNAPELIVMNPDGGTRILLPEGDTKSKFLNDEDTQGCVYTTKPWTIYFIGKGIVHASPLEYNYPRCMNRFSRV